MKSDPTPAFQNESYVPVPDVRATRIQQAIQDASKVTLRKLPLPKFFPTSLSQFGVDGLNLRDFHGHNPVKHVIDVVCAYDGPIDLAFIEAKVRQGDLLSLPAVCLPPPGKIDVEYFSQLALIKHEAPAPSQGPQLWDIVVVGPVLTQAHVSGSP